MSRVPFQSRFKQGVMSHRVNRGGGQIRTLVSVTRWVSLCWALIGHSALNTKIWRSVRGTPQFEGVKSLPLPPEWMAGIIRISLRSESPVFYLHTAFVMFICWPSAVAADSGGRNHHFLCVLSTRCYALWVWMNTLHSLMQRWRSQHGCMEPLRWIHISLWAVFKAVWSVCFLVYYLCPVWT